MHRWIIERICTKYAISKKRNFSFPATLQKINAPNYSLTFAKGSLNSMFVISNVFNLMTEILQLNKVKFLYQKIGYFVIQIWSTFDINAIVISIKNL